LEHSTSTEKNWRTTISVSVTAEDVKAQYDNAVKKVQKDVKLEGFRKGKVPVQMLKKLYGELIDAEAEDLCVQDAWRTVFKENNLHPIDDPQISNLTKDENGGTTFDIKFDVMPEFEVSGYEGMPIEKVTYTVNKTDVDAVIESLRERNAMLYSVEREAKEGDFIFVDLQEVDGSGVPVIGQKIDNQQIWLNADNKELTPQLLGVKAEDTRHITLKVKTRQSDFVEQPNLPEEIEKTYQVQVNEVKERRLPDLNDEFARDMGPYESVQELFDKIEKDLIHEAKHESEHAFENALAEALLDRIDLEVPESMLNNYLERIIQDAQAKDKERGQSFDAEEYRQVYKDGAVRDLKWHLVSEQLKKQEKFDVSDSDVEEKLAHYAEHGEDGTKRAEEIRNNQAELTKLKDSIILDKLYDFLAENATISEVEKSWSELVAPASPSNDEDAA